MQHDLLTFLRKDSNPTQARRRIKEMVDTGLSDLVLISNQTPSHVLEEFFSTYNVFSLIDSLLGVNVASKQHKKLDARSSELAAGFAERALIACIRHHKLVFENTEALAEPILSHLNKSISICRDLAYKIELIEQDKIAFDEDILYLFDWTRISQIGEKRLSTYINREMEIPVDSIFIENINERFISMQLSISEYEEPILASITVKNKNSAKLYVDIGKNSKVTTILDIKERNGHRYVFGRRMTREQSKAK